MIERILDRGWRTHNAECQRMAEWLDTCPAAAVQDFIIRLTDAGGIELRTWTDLELITVRNLAMIGLFTVANHAAEVKA